MSPTVPQSPRVGAAHSYLGFDGFEAAMISQSSPHASEIEVGLVQWEVGEGGEQHGKVKRRAIEGYEEIIGSEFVTELPPVERLSSHE